MHRVCSTNISDRSIDRRIILDSTLCYTTFEADVSSTDPQTPPVIPQDQVTKPHIADISQYTPHFA